MSREAKPPRCGGLGCFPGSSGDTHGWHCLWLLHRGWCGSGQSGGVLGNYAFWESRQDSVHACGMGQLYLDGQCNFPGRA